MAVTYRTSNEQVFASPGGTAAPRSESVTNMPSGLAADDLLVIDIWSDGSTGATIDTPSGFTAFVSQINGQDGWPQYKSFWKKATGSETSITIGFSTATTYDIYVVTKRCDGQDLTTPVDGTPYTATPTGNGNTISGGSATVARDGSLVYQNLGVEGDSTTTFTVPTSTTGIQDRQSAFPAASTAYIAQNAGTYTSGDWTVSRSGTDNQDGVVFLAVIQPPAAGGGTTRGTPFGHRGTAFNGGRTFHGIIQ